MKMFRFNIFCALTTRCTSRLLRPLNMSFSTNLTTLNSEVDNKVELSEGTIASNALEMCIETRKFYELKKEICSSLELNSSVVHKVQNTKNFNSLLKIIKLYTNNDQFIKANEVIAEWSALNNKVTPIIEEENCYSALHIYDDLSTSEIVKKIHELAVNLNRNVKHLNYFFNHILTYNEVLSLQQCSSLLHSLSILNYSDERLLKKICSNIMDAKEIDIKTLTTIIKYMTYIRYRNKEFFLHVCKILTNIKCNMNNVKSLTTILYSCAKFGYFPDHYKNVLQTTFLLDNIPKTFWINVVWSLAVFKMAQTEHVQAVLNDRFIQEILYNVRTPTSIYLKLLNINGYAQYALQNYKGPFLNHEIVPCVTKDRSKQQEMYVKTLHETLENMFSPSHFKINQNTNMGFTLDAELHIDSKLNVINTDITKEPFTKIGIIIVDYYSTYLRESDYTGIIQFYEYLLKCKNYEVLCLSYKYFGLEDKIEKRVSYLQRRLNLNKSSN